MTSKLKVLVPIDFSECSRRALAQVLAWSGRAPCEIHVVHVVNGEVEELGSEETTALAHGLFELERATGEAVGRQPSTRERSGAIQHHVSVGHPARVIVEAAKRMDVDLIAMGTHGRTGLTQTHLGSVAGDVVRQAHCPVVCVQPGAVALPAPRILCAVDFSETSRRAMHTAARLARHLGVELVLLHVRMLLELNDADAKLAGWKREAEAAGAKVTTACTSGAAAAQIVAYARTHGCGVIVMGTHGRTGLAHLLMGSVAEGVVRNASCPVLTLSPAVTAPAHAEGGAA